MDTAGAAGTSPTWYFPPVFLFSFSCTSTTPIIHNKKQKQISSPQVLSLHKLANGIDTTISNKDLPYGGFRSDSTIRTIQTFSCLQEFWKDTALSDNSNIVSYWMGSFEGLHYSYPAREGI